MAQKIYENPVDPPGYLVAFLGNNVELPLSPSGIDLGTLLDAKGRDVLTIDVNGDRNDAEVEALTAYLCMAINQVCGFKAIHASVTDAGPTT